MAGGGDPLTGWFNTAAFKRPAGRGDFGNAPRNAVQRPGFNNWNLAVFKNVAVGGRRALQFRWEIYNVLDTVQFIDIDRAARLQRAGGPDQSDLRDGAGHSIAHRAAAHDAALGAVYFLGEGRMKRIACLVVVLAVVAVVSGPEPFALSPQPFGDQPPARVDPAKEKRLEWFREAKYGLFIHWGLYAIPPASGTGSASPASASGS